MPESGSDSEMAPQALGNRKKRDRKWHGRLLPSQGDGGGSILAQILERTPVDPIADQDLSLS
jgi:hypothetical protein